MNEDIKLDINNKKKTIKFLTYILIGLLVANLYLINQNRKQNEYIQNHHFYITSQPSTHVEYAAMLVTRALTLEDPVERGILLDRSAGHLFTARGYMGNMSQYFYYAGKLNRGRNHRTFNSLGIKDFFDAYSVKLTMWSDSLINQVEGDYPTDEELLTMQRDLFNISRNLASGLHELDGYEINDLFVKLAKEAKTPNLSFRFLEFYFR